MSSSASHSEKLPPTMSGTVGAGDTSVALVTSSDDNDRRATLGLLSPRFGGDGAGNSAGNSCLFCQWTQRCVLRPRPAPPPPFMLLLLRYFGSIARSAIMMGDDEAAQQAAPRESARSSPSGREINVARWRHAKRTQHGEGNRSGEEEVGG